MTVLRNTENLAKQGYTFSGWNTEQDGKGTPYAPGATFTIQADTTLYAQWEAIPATAPTIDTQLTNLSLIYGYEDGSLTITASVADGHTPSYQWYKGNPAELIEGADQATYNISAGMPAGTTETYYCVVTATRTDNGETATVTSEPATVTVGKRPVTVSGITASGKEYDGGTSATLITTEATLDGKLENDDLSTSL